MKTKTERIVKKKVAINVCFGGFSLSPLGYALYAELKGKKAYFFTHRGLDDKFNFTKNYPISLKEAETAFIFNVYTVPNPDEVNPSLDWYTSNWYTSTSEQKNKYNKNYRKISLYSKDMKREDPILIKVIEKLGAKASGKHGELKVVEIPADVEYTIEECDGLEHIAEKHRTWR